MPRCNACGLRSLVLAVMLVGPSLRRLLRADISAEQVREAIDRGRRRISRATAESRRLLARLGRLSPAGSPRCAPWPCSTRASSPTIPSVQAGPGLAPRRSRARRPPTPSPCRRWSSARPDRRSDMAADRRQRRLARADPDPGRAATRGPGPIRRPAANGDNSNSQFALLALHEAERVGRDGRAANLAAGQGLLGRLPERRRLLGILPKRQSPGTGSMTCAGIASLVIAADKVRQTRRPGRRRPDPVLPAGRIGRRPHRARARSGWAATSRSTGNPGTRRHVAALLPLRPRARGPAHRPAVHRRPRLVSRRRRLPGQGRRTPLSGFWKGIGP